MLLQGTLPEGSNKWEGSRTFLNVHAGHSRLAASVAHEHSIMCAAHASFRQVGAIILSMITSPSYHTGSYGAGVRSLRQHNDDVAPAPSSILILEKRCLK